MDEQSKIQAQKMALTVEKLQSRIAFLENELSQCQARDKSTQEMPEQLANFIANFNHELLTPLNSIIGLLELSLEMPLSTKLHDYLTQAYNSSDKLKKVAENAQTLTKLTKHQIQLDNHSFDLYLLVEELTTNYIKLTARKSLELSVNIAPQVPYQLKGDSNLLKQVLTQLLDNAVKFTEKGSIKLSIEVDESQNDMTSLVFLVSDTGIGIAGHGYEKVFKPFYQCDSSSKRKYEGIGVGLSLSQQIVKLMGGQIKLDSKLGEGTTFSFKLSFDHPDTLAQDRYHLSKSSLPCRMLIINLSDSSCDDIYCSWINKFGLETDYIKTTEQLVELSNQPEPVEQSYDILLVHVETDSDKLLKILPLLLNLSQSIKTLALLPADYSEQLNIYQQLYVDKYIHKPITIPDFFNSIQEICSSQHAKTDTVSSDNSTKVIKQEGNTELKELLGLLVTYLITGDQAKADQAIKKIIQDYPNFELGHIQSQINEFDFNEAIESIASFAASIGIKDI